MEIGLNDEPVDRMDDGEIPWDFIKQNETDSLPSIWSQQRKKWNLPPFSYFDDPLQVSFLFV